MRQKVRSGMFTHLVPDLSLFRTDSCCVRQVTIHENITSENTGATIPMIPQNIKRAAKGNDHLLQPKEENIDSNKGKGNSRMDDHPSGETHSML